MCKKFLVLSLIAAFLGSRAIQAADHTSVDANQRNNVDAGPNAQNDEIKNLMKRVENIEKSLKEGDIMNVALMRNLVDDHGNIEQKLGTVSAETVLNSHETKIYNQTVRMEELETRMDHVETIKKNIEDFVKAHVAVAFFELDKQKETEKADNVFHNQDNQKKVEKALCELYQKDADIFAKLATRGFSWQSVTHSLKSAITPTNMLTGAVCALAANTILQFAHSSFSQVMVPILTQSYNMPFVGGACKTVGEQLGHAATVPSISFVPNALGGGFSWYKGVPLLLLGISVKYIFDFKSVCENEKRGNHTSHLEFLKQCAKQPFINYYTSIKNNYTAINSSISGMAETHIVPILKSHIVPLGIGAGVLFYYIAANKK